MIDELFWITPEIALTIGAMVVLLADLFFRKRFPQTGYLLSQLTLLAAFVLTLNLVKYPSQQVFSHSFVMDGLGNFLKSVIYVFASFVLMYSREYIEDRKFNSGEYYVLSLFSILGMMILISAGSLLTLYLGLELVSLPLYALIAFAKETEKAEEASMKYFVMGALASGILLYGISLLYGITGSFDIKTVSTHLMTYGSNTPVVLVLSIVLVLAGLGFKLGAVPFHMWIPDVYQGSPSSVTLFIGTLPKLAGFGMAIRLLKDTLMALQAEWSQVLMIMAVLSLAVGNIAAIQQTNLKRMLGYSTIAHIGFVLLGLLAGPRVDFSAALAYVIIYSLMALGAFGIIVSLSTQGFEAEKISDFKGLGRTHPWIAFLMLLILFSLAGVPPLVGFYAKLMVLNALIEAGFVGLAIVAVLFTVIGAYYYLNVVRVMFFEEPVPSSIPTAISTHQITALSLNGLAVLLLGIFPAPLIALCLAALGGL